MVSTKIAFHEYSANMNNHGYIFFHLSAGMMNFAKPISEGDEAIR